MLQKPFLLLPEALMCSTLLFHFPLHVSQKEGDGEDEVEEGSMKPSGLSV